MKEVKRHVSIAYKLLHFYSKILIWHWFSEVEVNGKENIPEGAPCILLPCHQNGLMDCVTLLAIFKKPITFFAKSALFVNKMALGFLTFLRIMPAYRQREGIQNVTKNEDNFLKAVDLLLLGFPLCIMPEGGQHEKHHLYPFVKGPFRIAFYTQENTKNNNPVYLLPIGIDYSHYDRMGYPLVLNIAKPISMDAYMEIYRENPAKALNIVKEEAYKRLSDMMLNICSEEYYDVIYTSAYLYNFSILRMLHLDDNQTNRMKARQFIVKHLDEIVRQSPEKLQALANKCIQWIKKKPDFVSITNDFPKQKGFSVFCYVLFLFPVFVYGLSINIFVVLLVLYLNPKLKNTGFSSTLKYVFFLLLSPVNHLLISILAAILFSSWLVFFVIFLTGMPVTVFCGKYVKKLRVLKNKLLLKKHTKYMVDICKELDILFKGNTI
ncbi:MAG: 1-acyl-sn-glycerol-3-phosphate acyltransferase [Bacteroidales bacterium]|jgi:1-acyl-sn-glycerol-3-phosphate acyltransferase|nr:1-acyl-sn-glycerol-3-phosphate acyltransferase [Bacteroidales bacterium]